MFVEVRPCGLNVVLEASDSGNSGVAGFRQTVSRGQVTRPIAFLRLEQSLSRADLTEGSLRIAPGMRESTARSHRAAGRPKVAMAVGYPAAQDRKTRGAISEGKRTVPSGMPATGRPPCGRSRPVPRRHGEAIPQGGSSRSDRGRRGVVAPSLVTNSS